ncbi:MAG: glycine/sarcosine/betaine reductase selenoprotein B family protein [Dehalococcoidia bacterium]|nr:glycine/sarcosine/betaine reductase selenoprotein B family protein [Dehalococcoidia bacterium]
MTGEKSDVDKGQESDAPSKPSVVDLRSEPVPWTPITKPLSRCRVALVTTAGVYVKSQAPFDVTAKDGDPSFRGLPSSTPLEEYKISHTHYDHSDADRDINCVFPISRVKEMVDGSLLGSVAEVSYGFMGFIKDLEGLKVNARTVAGALLVQGVDVVLGTPG